MEITEYEGKVIQCETKEERDKLIEELEKNDYEYSIPFHSLAEFAVEFEKDDGVQGCWRIDKDRGVAYNPSPEHWMDYGYDVVKMKDIM